jgi:hypothetical protein
METATPVLRRGCRLPARSAGGLRPQRSLLKARWEIFHADSWIHALRLGTGRGREDGSISDARITEIWSPECLSGQWGRTVWSFIPLTPVTFPIHSLVDDFRDNGDRRDAYPTAGGLCPQCVALKARGENFRLGSGIHALRPRSEVPFQSRPPISLGWRPAR